MPRIELRQGQIEYTEAGKGPVVVFVHGALVDSALWKEVAERVAGSHRVIVPDWPMGSHRIPMAADADLSPRGMADVVADALEALDLRDVTLVGNDTGGAVCQLVCARRPERVARLVLTNCDALECFPPPAFAYLKTVQRIPGLPWLAAKLLHGIPALRRQKTAFGGLTARPLSDAQLGAWVEPIASDGAIRRDLKKLVLGMAPEVTLEAAGTLRRFAKPVTLVWGTADPFFPVALGERLAAVFPRAELHRIDGAKTFVPLDAPDRVAALIAGGSTVRAAS